MIQGLHGHEHVADPMPSRVKRVAYMRRACDYVEAHRGDVVRLADLAGVVGVSMARRSLLVGRSAGVSVSDVALDHGFGHFGYFARDYKALFGERPREMLANGAPRDSRAGRATIPRRLL